MILAAVWRKDYGETKSKQRDQLDPMLLLNQQWKQQGRQLLEATGKAIAFNSRHSEADWLFGSRVV